MKKTALLLVATTALALFAPPVSYAYDKAGHYVLLYAIAVINGFSPQDAALIASGSQSLDENEVTTAFSLPKFGKEMAEAWSYYTGGEAEYEPADMPHMASGQVFHALTEHRELVENTHLRRLGSLSGPGLTEQQRRRRLLYLGQYLHFVADEVVHPTDPMWGHASEGTVPDQIDTDPVNLRAMITLISFKLQQFNPSGPRLPADTRSASLEIVARAIEDTWKPTALDYVGAVGVQPDFADRVREHRESGHTDIFHPFDEMRAANAAHRVRQALLDIQRSGVRDRSGRPLDFSYIPHSKIELDVNGDPVPTAANRLRFGSTSRSIEELPFATVLSRAPELRSERSAAWESVVRSTRELGFRGLAPPSVVGTLLEFQDSTNVDAVWALPGGPGGVALNPKLVVPSSIGDVRELSVRGDEVVLVTDEGEFSVSSIEPRGMATILRAVVAGEVPYVSIGSETSDRTGFAKVTYSRSLRGTREGALLYRADVQFKGIFAGFPLGESYRLNRTDDDLMGGFPGGGGEFQRFWITSSRIKLEQQGEDLVTQRHGMRILSETKLQDQTVRDPALESYVERLTANWDQIADELWEFRAVQALALETALAFWVRDRQIAVDPVLLSMPPVADHTPDYAPIIVRPDQDFATAGGVTLTPESAAQAQGRMFLTTIAALFDAEDQSGRLRILNRALFGGLALILAVTLVLASAIPFWWIGRRITWRSRLTYRDALKVWTLALSAQAIVAVLSAPLVFGLRLGSFDRDFLAFIATIAAGPCVLFWSIGVTRTIVASDLYKELSSGIGQQLAVVTYSLAVPLVSAIVGLAVAVLTISIVGPVPSQRLEVVLSGELAPINVLGKATMSAGLLESGAPIIYPVPESLQRAHRAPFIYAHRPAPERLEDRLVVPGEEDSHLPVYGVRRVEWPARMEVPISNQYTADGKPPY